MKVYKMKIHIGAESNGKYLLKPLSDEPEVFDNLDKLHRVGQKIMSESSHRVWYDYEKVI